MKENWWISLRKLINAYIPLFTIAGVVVFFDQLTKSIIRSRLDFSEVWTPWVWFEPYARFVHWKNTGAAFGMLQEFGGVFTILAIIVSIAILYYFPQVPKEDRLLRIAMGLQLGGALGNLIDRVTIGWVTDFISIWKFPVFNLADLSITIGVGILILGIWIKEREKKPIENKAGTPPDADSAAASSPEETWSE